MALQSTRRCTNKVIYSCLVAVGFILFLFGIIFGVAVRNKIADKVKTTTEICKDSEAFDDWRKNTDSDDPAKYKMYYGFNATNAAAYMGQVAAVNLSLNAVGPYAMRQYDTYYNISFHNGEKELNYKTYSRFVFDESKSCKNCKNTDYFTGVNPGLLTLMSAASSELVIGLLISSANLDYQMGVCNSTTIPYSLATTCDVTLDKNCCCNNTDTTTANGCYPRAAALYSTFASFDGGVSFISPVLRKQVVSPLFITKNVHEFAYGYPSGLLGLALAQLQPAGVPAMAKFTELMVRACNYSTEGVSPAVENLEKLPWQFLGGITCAPIAASKYWATQPDGFPATRCNVVNQAKGITNACKCVYPTHGDNGVTTVEKPCCTQAGLGCLYKVKGYVSDSLYLSENESFQMYGDDNTTQYTGCGGNSADEKFGWTRYEGLNAKPAWAQLSRAPQVPPSQLDVAATMQQPALLTVSNPVRGSDGTRFKPTGVTASITSDQLSDGSGADTHDVYITQVYRATTLQNAGAVDFHGIKTLKYEPRDEFLNNASLALPSTLHNFEVGAATPFDGVQDATFMYGFPVYVSLPMFRKGSPYGLHQVPQGCKGTACSGIHVTLNGKEVNQNDSQFETYLLVEPASGVTISGHKRMMASFRLYECVSPKQGCQTQSLANLLNPLVPGGVVIPQYYMDETSEATSDQIDKLKLVMSLNHSAGVILIVLPIVGALLAAMSGYMLYSIRRQQRGSVIQTSLMSDRD